MPLGSLLSLVWPLSASPCRVGLRCRLRSGLGDGPGVMRAQLADVGSVMPCFVLCASARAAFRVNRSQPELHSRHVWPLLRPWRMPVFGAISLIWFCFAAPVDQCMRAAAPPDPCADAVGFETVWARSCHLFPIGASASGLSCCAGSGSVVMEIGRYFGRNDTFSGGWERVVSTHHVFHTPDPLPGLPDRLPIWPQLR